MRPDSGGFRRLDAVAAEGRGDARRLRRTRPEILGVEAVASDPPACKPVDEIAHKGGRTADVEVGIGRDPYFLDHGHIHASHRRNRQSADRSGLGAL